MPTYIVTFCTMDEKTNSSRGWHTCILLSKFDEKTKKMEVIDTWSFYGLPSTADKNVFIQSLKKTIRLNLDFTGNHGMLRHEEMRYLELGYGLHGASFEVTEEKFNELEKKCIKMAVEQMQAIQEIADKLHLSPKSPENTRIYSFEHCSKQIFSEEIALSKQRGTPPRLEPFELIHTINNCKVQALKLLDGILTPEQLKRLRGRHPAVPRFSGKTESFALHSTGPVSQHIKKSGEVVYSRNGNDPNVKLYWSHPPQEIETLSDETRNLFKIRSGYEGEVKKVICQLQRLEWLFTNAPLKKRYHSYRDQLIQVIREHYEVFARIEPKKLHPNKGCLANSLSWLFFQPRDEEEAKVIQQLGNAKNLFNSLYMAALHDWKIDARRCNPHHSLSDINDYGKEPDSKNLDLEGVASHLPVSSKRELCQIMDRSFDTSWQLDKRLKA